MDFCVFVITFKRAKTIKTVDTLRNHGYTGKCYLVLSDDDPTIDEYIEIFGKENCLIFNKQEIEKIVDTQDNFKNYTTALFARQFCIEYARDNDIKYYCVFDDDCINARFRYEKDGGLRSRHIKDLDSVFKAVVKFLSIDNITTISASVAGAFIGGLGSRPFVEKLYRDGAASWFHDSSKYVKYSGTSHEDLNIQLINSPRGMNFFSICDFTLDFEPYYGNPNGGGLCDTYANLNIYTRQFYSLMTAVSCIKLQPRMKKDGTMTVIRRIKRDALHPKILSDKYKKTIDKYAF